MPRAKPRILVVDDHREMAEVLAEGLGEEGYVVTTVDSGAGALASARAANPDVVITDLRMERVDGFDVLEGIRQLDPGIPVLIMTAFGAIETAIEAIKRGAYHYLTKPVQLEEVRIFVARALAARQLRDENIALRRVVDDRSRLGIVGRSPRMRALHELVDRVAQSAAPVLILGESGSGKELIARALHFQGPRRERPFVAVNCTALPEALLESELFGHTRGAFTGATSARRGLFVEADGGTLFLDEIGDMAPPLQAKLLRAIEDGEVRAVGADASRNVDVRLVAATHQDLETRVREGRFRSDLYYRLNVVSLAVPPLRTRAEDIPLLVATFLERARERNPGTRVERIADDVAARFVAAPWPGNVRELENVIERLVIVSAGPVVSLEDVRLHAPQVLLDVSPLARAHDRIVSLRQLEDDYIAWVVAQCGGNKTKAAELLQIDVSTIHRREQRR